MLMLVYAAAFTAGMHMALKMEGELAALSFTAAPAEITAGYVARLFFLRYGLVGALLISGAMGKMAVLTAPAATARKALDDGMILTVLWITLHGWQQAAGAMIYLLSMVSSVPIVIILAIKSADHSVNMQISRSGNGKTHLEGLAGYFLALLLLIPSVLLYILVIRLV